MQLPNHDSIIEDLDNMPGTVPTISNHISLIHSNGSNDNDNNNQSNHFNHTANHVNSKHPNAIHNNNATNASQTFRSMLEEAETNAIDGA